MPRLPDYKKAKYLVVYLCPECGLDSGMTDLDEPHCFGCDNAKGMKEIERHELTPQAMADRMKKVNDRMVDNLKSAYAVGAEEMGEDFDDKQMLDLLDRADKLRTDTNKMMSEAVKRSKEKE